MPADEAERIRLPRGTECKAALERKHHQRRAALPWLQCSTITGHGFRDMARTVLGEVPGFRPDFIEHQLAHAVRNPLGRAYNRIAHLAERKKMMQAWVDYLDQLREDANKVDPLRRAGKGSS